MRTSITLNWRAVLYALYGVLLGIAALSGAAKTARAQLYVSQLGILTVSEYNAATGEATNADLITRLSGPSGLAAQSNTLFVADFARGTVGKYDATTGKVIDANFITSAGIPTVLALLDNTLFVANETGTIGKYDATTGEAINANFITGLQFTAGLAVKSGK